MTDVECSLCESTFGEIAVGLVEWADGLSPLGRRFDTIPRCRDRAGCRARVEAKRRPWPLAPSSSDPRPTPDPDPEPEVIPEPLVDPRPGDLVAVLDERYAAMLDQEEELDLLDEARPW